MFKNNEKFKILNSINSPNDLKNINDFEEVCYELRKKILEVVSENGGHLASNLGVVELTVALLKVFNQKDDKIVWDVGHQCYAYKILTGRFKQMDSLRKEGGISGFSNRFESDFDVFTTGHCSTSISSAFGIAQAKKICGESGHVIAVIGDGSLTGGLAFEGLNNLGRFDKNFIVVLNDNKMSISQNVGSISKYLAEVRIKPSYFKLKNAVEKIFKSAPAIGIKIINILSKFKSALKDILYESTFFEDMGFAYYGPIDGHDTQKIISILHTVKNLKRPVIVHIVTKKGKGYEFSEKNPKDFHGVPKFEILTGSCAKKNETFSDVFGKELCKLTKNNSKICAITAAMTSGTGLTEFSQKFENNFFDVGIAESHAITFAGGLSAGGLHPVFAVYSSFLQRSYDQIIHDLSLQNLKMTIAIDRAGLVGEDGETHQGVFDVPMLNSIPNVTILAPSYFDELKSMLNLAVFGCKNISVVRYPRGGEFFKPNNYVFSQKSYELYGEKTDKILIITYGRIFSNACLARLKLIEENIFCCILKLNVIKPIVFEALEIAKKYEKIFFFEESNKNGGVGEKFLCELFKIDYNGKFLIIAVEDDFIKHASVQSQLKKYYLDSEGMCLKIKESLD